MAPNEGLVGGEQGVANRPTVAERESPGITLPMRNNGPRESNKTADEQQPKPKLIELDFLFPYCACRWLTALVAGVITL